MTPEPSACAFCTRPALPAEFLVNDDSPRLGDGVHRPFHLCNLHLVTLAEAGIHGWLAPDGVRYWLVR